MSLRVVFMGTGEEIIEAPATPGPWQIYDSGSVALRAMAQAWGARAERARAVRDDLASTIEAIRTADADLVVTVGGASVGDYDLVRAAGEALGLRLDVSSVNVRPGKPTFFGVLGDGRHLLGLPGNPASAFVCASADFGRGCSAASGSAAAVRVATSTKMLRSSRNQRTSAGPLKRKLTAAKSACRSLSIASSTAGMPSRVSARS